jgi:hypothetical protein
MRRILSATALSAVLALAMPALAQTGSTGSGAGSGTGSMGTSPGGAQMQGQTPGSPLPMTQPSPGTMSTTQRPSTAAGAMGATSGSQQGGTMPGHSGQSMGQSGMGQSGTSGSQSMTMDETQVRDLLRSQGYGDVQSVTRDGDNYRARVTRNGRQADISIDAYTGTIRNQAARR